MKKGLAIVGILSDNAPAVSSLPFMNGDLKCASYVTDLFLAWASQLQAATYTVNNRADDGSSLTAGTLRWAISQANTNPGLDTIVFSLANSITVCSGLMIMDQVVIDGGGTQVVGAISSFSMLCLFSGSGGSTIQNLIVLKAGDGIVLGSDNNIVQNCRIGITLTDTGGQGCINGIYLLANTANNVIQFNVISCNSRGILAEGTRRMIVQGNRIGTDATGIGQRGNTYGIYLTTNSGYGCVQCIIGGDLGAGEGNLISGNSSGIYVNGPESFGNTICGNTIGLNLAQTAAIPNSTGIYGSGARGNWIGLPDDNMQNTIAGNTGYGIRLDSCSSWKILNNYIGVTMGGTTFANTIGFWALAGHSHLIGESTADYRYNVISGNTDRGLGLTNAHGNTVTGNRIGTTLDGMAQRANGYGVKVESGNDNLFRENLLSGNANGAGISVYGGLRNKIQSNLIGLNADRTAAIPNAVGVSITSQFSMSTLVGGNILSGEGNVIAGNSKSGVWLQDTYGHAVTGNWIGVAESGGNYSLRANGHYPIYMTGAMGCKIGGSATEINVIGGASGYSGIHLANASSGNTVAGNYINRLPNGQTFPATGFGIRVDGASHDNKIGMRGGPGNVIYGWEFSIAVYDPSTDRNGIYSNVIYGFSNTITGEAIRMLAANSGKEAPTITSAIWPNPVAGIAQPNNYIEIYKADRIGGYQGGCLQLVGTATADGAGNWSCAMPALS